MGEIYATCKIVVTWLEDLSYMAGDARDDGPTVLRDDEQSVPDEQQDPEWLTTILTCTCLPKRFEDQDFRKISFVVWT